MKRRRRLHEWESARADDVSTLTWVELCALEERGLITRSEVARITAEQVKAANGGVDPYEHLRAEWDVPEREYRPRPHRRTCRP